MTPEERAERRRQKILARAQNNPLEAEYNDNTVTQRSNTEEQSSLLGQENQETTQIKKNNETQQEQQQQQDGPDAVQKYKILKNAEKLKFRNRVIGFFISILLGILSAFNFKGIIASSQSFFTLFITYELLFSAYRIFKVSKTINSAQLNKDGESLGGLEKMIPQKYGFLIKIVGYVSQQGSHVAYIADEVCAYIIFFIITVGLI